MLRIELTAENDADMAAQIASLNNRFNPSTSTIAVARATKDKVAPKEEPFDAKADAVEPQEQTVEDAVEATAEAPAEEAKPARRRARTPAAEPAETAPDATAAAKSSPKAEPEVSEAILRNLVLKLMNAKGRDTVASVLGQFGINRATEIDDARAAELVTALEDAARP